MRVVPTANPSHYGYSLLWYLPREARRPIRDLLTADPVDFEFCVLLRCGLELPPPGGRGRGAAESNVHRAHMHN